MKDKQYYKERIAELISGVDSVSTLKYICTVIESYLRGRSKHESNK